MFNVQTSNKSFSIKLDPETRWSIKLNKQLLSRNSQTDHRNIEIELMINNVVPCVEIEMSKQRRGERFLMTRRSDKGMDGSVEKSVAKRLLNYSQSLTF